MRITLVRGIWALLIVVAVASAFYAFRASPVLVDTTAASRGPMEVTVSEEGRTRIREVYSVSAPVTGKLLRLALEEGDEVNLGQTVVATIQPGDPTLLDVRTRQELEATVAAAQAAVALAEAQVKRAEAELAYAQSELERAESLSENLTVSESELDRARMEAQMREAEVASALANLELKRQELESARARLSGPEVYRTFDELAEQCCVQVRAPASGQVLAIHAESEQYILAGTPILDIGNPQDLEIVVDLLSADAVLVEPGADAYVENWGGSEDLTARVERIEPAGFTEISALGIEEQRVNTVLSLTSEPSQRSGLGHNFRVYVRIIVWQADDVLRVPISSIFRHESEWAVFTSDGASAHLVQISLGQRNSQYAEVLGGLEEGQQVILHPSDRVADGTEIEQRLVE